MFRAYIKGDGNGNGKDTNKETEITELFYINSYIIASEWVRKKMKVNHAEDRKVRTLTRGAKSGKVMCHCQKGDIVALFFT